MGSVNSINKWDQIPLPIIKVGIITKTRLNFNRFIQRIFRKHKQCSKVLTDGVKCGQRDTNFESFSAPAKEGLQLISILLGRNLCLWYLVSIVLNIYSALKTETKTNMINSVWFITVN